VPFGALMGLGAMLGELPNSFVKRRVGIAPGKATSGAWSVLFYVWDQVDLVFGAWALTWWGVRPSALLIAASFAMALVAHPLVSLVGWLVGARQHAR
jgi:CDP-archaeol synthase